MIMNIIQNISHQHKAIFICSLSCVVWVIAFFYASENGISPFVTSIWKAFMMILINMILILGKQLRINILDDVEYLWCMLKVICFIICSILFCNIFYYFPLPFIFGMCSTSQVFGYLVTSLVEFQILGYSERMGLIILILGIILCCLNSNISQYSQFLHYESKQTYGFIFILGYLFVDNLRQILNKRQMNTHESIIRLYSGIGLFFTSFVFANTPIQEGYVQFSDISITQFLSGFFLCGLLITISQLMRYRSSQMYIFNKEAGMIQFCTLFPAYIISIFHFKEEFNFFLGFGNLLIIYGSYRILK